jgi:hypothetical protein
MKRLLLCLALASFLLPTSARAQFEMSISIGLPVVPPLVVIQPGVQVVENHDEEVFYVDNGYWVRRGPRWYRAPRPHASFVYVEPDYVPYRLSYLPPPGHYRRWHKHRIKEERRWWREHDRERRRAWIQHQRHERRRHHEERRHNRDDRHGWRGDHGHDRNHGYDRGPTHYRPAPAPVRAHPGLAPAQHRAHPGIAPPQPRSHPGLEPGGRGGHGGRHDGDRDRGGPGLHR